MSKPIESSGVSADEFADTYRARFEAAFARRLALAERMGETINRDAIAAEASEEADRWAASK